MQTGFGWTNGVVFELLNRWGDAVSYELNNGEMKVMNNEKLKIINQLFN